MTQTLFDAIRDIKGAGVRSGKSGLTQAEVDRVNRILVARSANPAGTTPASSSSTATTAAPPAAPAWLAVARGLIGQREIPGPEHNGWIAQGWARLGAGWFNDDETPWCGFFVAHCLDAAGLPFPGRGAFARALSWADYGVACAARPGAIAVKKRPGGNHVFFIVGQTPDRRFYKALGGNQSNAVTIMDVAKSEVFAMRWPASVAQPPVALPVLPAGTVLEAQA